MKHLSEYAIYHLFEAENDEHFTLSKEMIDAILKLADNTSLEDYVGQLNDMLKNDDAKNILNTAFGHAKTGYKFKINGNKLQAIKVVDLHPTQSEIDIKNSLGYPFEHGVDTAEENGKKYYGDKPVSMPFPLITFNGEFILDGHHRWSQVYAFNKDASMMCLDIVLANDSDIKKVTATEMLKITQGFIAAKYADMGKKELPKSTAKPENNIFNMDEEKIKDIVQNEYVNKHKEEANKLAECAKLNSADEFADLLSKNIMDLKQNNEDYIKAAKSKGNSREFMPQTDKGAEDSSKADYEVEGSALNKMLKGTASKKALNKE